MADTSPDALLHDAAERLTNVFSGMSATTAWRAARLAAGVVDRGEHQMIRADQRESAYLMDVAYVLASKLPTQPDLAVMYANVLGLKNGEAHTFNLGPQALRRIAVDLSLSHPQGVWVPAKRFPIEGEPSGSPSDALARFDLVTLRNPRAEQLAGHALLERFALVPNNEEDPAPMWALGELFEISTQSLMAFESEGEYVPAADDAWHGPFEPMVTVPGEVRDAMAAYAAGVPA